MSSNDFTNELFLDILLIQERDRRKNFESSPTNKQIIIIEPCGTKYKIRENGKIWDNNIPSVICDDNDCIKQLKELSVNHTQICNNILNIDLLRMLCQWRKHIKETFIEEQKFNSDKWKKTQICTSELTFLGRKTEIGGIIGIISITNKHICSLPSLVSLIEKEDNIHNGVKGLSIGFAILIAMYMNWTLYTEENKVIVTKLLKKIRRNGLVGIDTYSETPWYYMFKCILERKRIPDKLKEIILSRAHLP